MVRNIGSRNGETIINNDTRNAKTAEKEAFGQQSRVEGLKKRIENGEYSINLKTTATKMARELNTLIGLIQMDIDDIGEVGREAIFNHGTKEDMFLTFENGESPIDNEIADIVKINSDRWFRYRSESNSKRCDAPVSV